MRPRHLIALTFAACLLLVGYGLLAPSALPKTLQMRQKERALQQEIASLRQNMLHLHHQTRLLSGDTAASRQYLKKIAREELHYIGPNEYQIVLHPKKR